MGDLDDADDVNDPDDVDMDQTRPNNHSSQAIGDWDTLIVTDEDVFIKYDFYLTKT